MPVYTEILPPTKSASHTAITWRRARTAATRGGGFLTISSRRDQATYAVFEYPCQWDGRAFRFAKVAGGTDAEAGDYDVFCSRDGRHHRCDCRGFTRHGHCKHVAAAVALWDNGWLDLANPEADHATNE